MNEHQHVHPRYNIVHLFNLHVTHSVSGSTPSVRMFGITGIDDADAADSAQARQRLDRRLRTGDGQHACRAVIIARRCFQCVVIFWQTRPRRWRHGRHRPPIRIDAGGQIKPVGERDAIARRGRTQATAVR